VACMDDARYLLYDYRLSCMGCVDLRHLVPRTVSSANMYAEYFCINYLPVVVPLTHDISSSIAVSVVK